MKRNFPTCVMMNKMLMLIKWEWTLCIFNIVSESYKVNRRY